MATGNDVTGDKEQNKSRDTLMDRFKQHFNVFFLHHGVGALSRYSSCSAAGGVVLGIMVV